MGTSQLGTPQQAGTPQLVTSRLEDEWLTDLFGRHSRAVLAYARRRLDSAEDAEDVVVEVFATAWRRREAVPDEALPWLYATAGNVIAHVIRSDSRRTRLGTKLASVRLLHAADDDPAQRVADTTTAHDVVAAALDDLSESDAELLRLWAWEQLEPGEIAEVLGCSPGTARTRMHRARARLREALVHRGVSGPAVEGPDVIGTEVTGPDVTGTEVTGHDVISSAATDPAAPHPPGALASPNNTLTTPHGSEATR
jgi:RNA polymerase sigma-70 factor (ECF subfamily)